MERGNEEAHSLWFEFGNESFTQVNEENMRQMLTEFGHVNRIIVKRIDKHYCHAYILFDAWSHTAYMGWLDYMREGFPFRIPNQSTREPWEVYLLSKLEEKDIFYT